MSLSTAKTILRTSYSTHFIVAINKFHTSFPIYLDQRWRAARNLTKNPNTTGPLVTLSDYSFKDNKPVPYASRQLKRIQKHQEYMRKIIKLVGEIDFAVERHSRLLKEKEEQEQKILDSQLKPKGVLPIINE
ncbi:mitochondrial ribosomal protein L52 isoform X1 [Bombus vancouverensis nearcticus]|uniref:Large ribosomal subunit protein mL52 n=1 Tax=Bombus bifarius TaxID=103933 RepID=A0A6P8N8P2_9HYME|nr:39S ribosomal protein L52, mitochondrial [Bombus vancouverensis nearcticus]XP_033317383.1 39S ribosomal protein L52, mitochondrial [Bombus bifarius]